VTRIANMVGLMKSEDLMLSVFYGRLLVALHQVMSMRLKYVQ